MDKKSQGAFTHRISRRGFAKATTLGLGGLASAAGVASLLTGTNAAHANTFTGNTGVDFFQYDPLLLGPGATVTWSFWVDLLDPYHWSRFDAAPESIDGITREAAVQIVAEWATLVESEGGPRRLVTFKNVGAGYVWFRPAVIVAPRR